MMINEQETLNTAQAGVETAFDAIEKITDATQTLSSYVSYQKALTLQRESLEHIVGNLRDEKQRISLEIEKSRKDLLNIKNELEEEKKLVSSQRYATQTLFTPELGNAGKNDDGRVAYINTSPEEAKSRSAELTFMLPRRKLIFENEDMSFRCEEDECDADSSTTSDTNTFETISKIRTRKRSCIYSKDWSPKKWRRMIRTHRLKSILIG